MNARPNVLDGVDEVDDALLTGDTANEQDERPGRVDAVARQHGRVACRSILLQVDAVVNDADLLVRHAVQVVDVHLHRFGHGHHAIGILVGGALDPRRGVVSGAELFDLPRSVRLQRVGGEDEGGPSELLDETAGQVRVPGVAVDDVDGVERAGHGEVADQSVHELAVTRVARGEGAVAADTADAEIVLARDLVAEGQHLDSMAAVVEPGQFARQVLDVNTGAAVDVRRVLVGQDGNVHGFRGRGSGVSSQGERRGDRGTG